MAVWGCVCDPQEVHGHHYVQWIGSIFSDCIYTWPELIAFLFGLLNIGLWMMCQLPQIFENYNRSQVDGLAAGLLACWLLGDISNLAGCILTDQLPTQLYTSIYFCILDILLTGQYLYYTWGFPKKERRSSRLDDYDNDDSTARDDTSRLSEMYALPVLFIMFLGGVRVHGAFSGAAGSAALGSGRALLEAPVPCILTPVVDPTAKFYGRIVSWISAAFYFFSRCPQIWKNYKRQSVDGLAMLMFLLGAAANTAYGLSILLRFPPIDQHFYLETLPFLIGSLGTLVFDITILIQARLYAGNAPYQKIK